MSIERAVPSCEIEPVAYGAAVLIERDTGHGRPFHTAFPQSARPEDGQGGAKEFMCIGALPPFDHPHIFIDMGGESEAVCSYCSTHFVFDAKLHGGADPAECVLHESAPV